MGTDVEIIIAALQGQSEFDIANAMERAKEKVLLLESILSRFREDSEVSRINAGAGQWVDVSRDTVQNLLLAQDAYVRTRGFFNPFMGYVLEDLGYKVTFENIQHETELTLSAGVPFVIPVRSPLCVDKEGLRARLEPGYKIDLGGISKGWIVEQAADVLVEHAVTGFIINAGGDMVCRTSQGDVPWVIGITDPFDQKKQIVNVDLYNTCVATSGTYRRKWSVNHKEVHHIMDPFLGEPVKSDIISCTVMHRSLTEAEVLAKVALILGTSQGIPWLNEQSTDGWIIVTNTGEVKYSCNL